MTIEFTLPDIGEGLEEAEVIEWHVKPGDRIDRDQPFVDILTDKAQTEMPAPGAGTVVSLGAAVGDVVKVGDVLIVIDDGATDGASTGGVTDGASTGETADAPAEQATGGEPNDTGPARTDGRRAKAAPSTRRLAAELGIDLSGLNGTGPGGRILATDVSLAAAATTASPVAAVTAPPTRSTPSAAQTTPTTTAEPGPVATAPAASTTAPVQAPTPPATPARRRTPPPNPRATRSTELTGAQSTLGQMPFGTHPIRGIRRATARAMDLSWSTIPHVTAMDELDATELLLARSRAREALADRGGNVTPLALLLVAVARGLRRYPMMNATLDLADDRITIHEAVNLGVAVASERGLLVPVVRNADQLGVVEMAEEVARLSAAARAGSISTDDIAGGTFTVSNYGSNGGYFAAPIIRPGEAGIVGFGAITKRPLVVDDQVEARPVIPLVIAADHRLIDGDVLSAFQADLADSIARAITLLVG
ncbi:MAG: dihydrolipoamide acetyltransferase family protein [Actinomycetota bacterium]